MLSGRYLFAALVLAVSCFAKADTIDNFVITGDGNTITFSLPASPTDITPYLSGVAGAVAGFIVKDVPITFNGTDSVVQLLFPGQLLPSGGIDIYASSGLFQGLGLDGPDLFTGPELEPTFRTGTFTLLDSQSGCSWPICEAPLYTVTITPELPSAATPEPSTLMLLATGFAALVGFGMRGGRRAVRQ